MKFRPFILGLAIAGLVSGCGSSSDSVNVEETLDTTPPSPTSTLSYEYDPLLKRTRVNWEASASSDLQGYQIFNYDPDPLRESAYLEFGETGVEVTTFDMPYVETDTWFWVRVRAVDNNGNDGAFSPILAVMVKGSNFDEP